MRSLNLSPPELVQLVPRLSPPVTGVGDYAMLLAEALRQAHGIGTRFLVTDPQWSGPATVSGFPVARLNAKRAADLAGSLAREATSACPVLLHFVSYGYHQRGCPLWLLKGLRQWQASAAAPHLVVMFHELFVAGPVWSSSFWLLPVQRHITVQLARLADRCLTNRRASAAQIERFAPRQAGRIAVWPVFSTTGESAAPPPLAARLPELVIFGGGQWTTDALSRRARDLDLVCHGLGLARIVAIGVKSEARWSGRTPLEQTGILPAADVGRRLLRARAGFLDYHLGYLGKSTILASYCAHGLLPIFPDVSRSELDEDGLADNYVTVAEVAAGISSADQQRIASGALGWYQGHNLAATADAVADAIRR